MFQLNVSVFARQRRMENVSDVHRNTKVIIISNWCYLLDRLLLNMSLFHGAKEKIREITRIIIYGGTLSADASEEPKHI